MDVNKNQKLIEALEEEKERIALRNKPVKGHTLAIEYLKTGKFNEADVRKYDILQGVVEDPEAMYSDYL